MLTNRKIFHFQILKLAVYLRTNFFTWIFYRRYSEGELSE